MGAEGGQVAAALNVVIPYHPPIAEGIYSGTKAAPVSLFPHFDLRSVADQQHPPFQRTTNCDGLEMHIWNTGFDNCVLLGSNAASLFCLLWTRNGL